ncbi:MAG TPA: hypothetical protein VHV81_07950 [Steroidobacteraceae bacterium]|nr:hypothetical protein [Steroidobacteraceae bacterium]
MTAARWLARALGATLPAALARADDIRDIRGPKAEFPLWLALAIAAIVLIVIAAGFALWRRWRNRPARALLPFEIALGRLEGIRPLMTPSTVREYSVGISDIVRGYIEARFSVTATHLTTEEFLHGLVGEGGRDLVSHRDLLAHFLEHCDMAKFAAVSLSMPIMQELHDSAHRFVTETSKSLPPAAQAGAAAQTAAS